MTDGEQNPEARGIALKYQLDQLISLQKIDDDIQTAKKGLAQIPGQIQSAQSGMEEKQKRLDEGKKNIESLRHDRHQLEMDTQEENDHMAKAKTKLPVIKTNKEYTAILVEIDAIKERIGAFEDRELEIMETLETREKEIPSIEAEYKAEKEEFKQYQVKKEAEAERIKKELENFSSRREGVAKSLDQKWMRSYEKVARIREGLAVVPLKDGVCQGCFQIVLPQMVIEIKTSEKIHQCQHCTRFLYWMEESETETAMPK